LPAAIRLDRLLAPGTRKEAGVPDMYWHPGPLPSAPALPGHALGGGSSHLAAEHVGVEAP